LRVLNCAYNHPWEPEEKAALPFAGGIMQHGYQCGMIWGAALAAGVQAYKLHGAGPRAETTAIVAAQRLAETFRDLYKDINCVEITGIDKSSSVMQMITFFLLKGGTIGCFRMSAKYAKAAFAEINTALSKEPVEVPSSPVSCAGMLAKKMGVSELHTVMAASLAGGIGLSGGGCGVLGAAIWIKGLKGLEEGNTKIDFKNPEAVKTLHKFLKCTDYQFECCDIVGRKFESVKDHACYLAEGGCSELIKILADES
jgi:putative redox-active protein with C_GCAxxG_C_C motif